MENLGLKLFGGIYSGKKVLVTGNTGFKGGWLSLWLSAMGADVYGYADAVPTIPSFYKVNELESVVKQTWGDIKDLESVKKVIDKIKPDFIFHLAAQALVKESFKNPLDTFLTNGIGTANLLEALKDITFDCNVVLITSDKCYENVEWVWGYKETDHLGGKDPYSASKAVAEVIFHSYYHSFFKDNSSVKIATTRAGNVIGGGDWAMDRIVPDCFKNWNEQISVSIRRPNSTRPWQHVLEPLSGYLLLGSFLAQNKFAGESFNFGPPSNQNHSVKDLIKELAIFWEKADANNLIEIDEDQSFYEAGLLKLNTDKALFFLNWFPVMNFQETVRFTGEWYNNYYIKKDLSIKELSLSQLKEYLERAKQNHCKWIS